MKRRIALQSIIATSAGIAILPACNFFQEPLKVYANLPLDKVQRGMIEQLSKAILPTEGIEGYTTPETPLDFMLTMVNDSYPKEDIEKYISGVTSFQSLLKEKYNTSLQKLNPEQLKEVLTTLSSGDDLPESIKYFFNTTTQLTQRHFTSSEYYLSNFTDWEFAPGRYEGCAEIG